MEDKDDKKIVELSDQDLIDDGFMGDGESPRHFARLSLTYRPLVGAPKSRHTLSPSSRGSITGMASLPPPELLYRSDLDSNPFPVPVPGTRWFELPVKTAKGVFGTRLNMVWHTVAPLIVASMKKRHIKYSALKAARFSTRDDDGKKTLGPITIWIATHPTTTCAEKARDNQVEGAVVEWYQGSVKKLSGLALLRVADETNPTYSGKADAQGTVSFFFHENKDRNGDPSARVFAVSNKHVLREDTTVDYQFMGPGAPRQYTRALVAANVAEAVRLTEEIVRLEAKPKSGNQEQAEDDEEALETKQGQLKKVIKDNGRIQKFFKGTDAQFHDIARRNIGFVDWAPKISTE
ncbi:hypothetical protein FRC11_008929, partial [Ceratobasidium sp. 423]